MLVDGVQEQDVGEVVVTDGCPVELDREVGRTVTVHVADSPAESVVLVSLTDEETIADEDCQLLELLVSHAGMSLDRSDPETATH